jgi:hypothetical protein
MNNLTTYFQRQAIEAFEDMHHQGVWTRKRNALTGKPTALPGFEQVVPHHMPHRQYMGMQEVELARIVGSLGRREDFSPGFQPLRRALQDRWVQIFQLAREDRWEPVQLVKVGTQYFVEDGNHRVSVAHYLGRSYIDAEVWEHPVAPTFTLHSSQVRCSQPIAMKI